jgi:hypothetical protein
MTDYLEQLLGEWYEYQGYFLHRDLWVGLDRDGRYECELDLVAFNPHKNHLVHLEMSVDLLPWREREEHFTAKFEAGRKYLHRFAGFQPSATLEQIAVVVVADALNHQTVAGARILLVQDLLAEILRTLRSYSLSSSPMPPQWPLLRALQLVSEHRDSLCEALLGNRPDPRTSQLSGDLAR